MAKNGATHKPSDDYSDGDGEASLAISYTTEDVKHILKGLLRIAGVVQSVGQAAEWCSERLHVYEPFDITW